MFLTKVAGSQWNVLKQTKECVHLTSGSVILELFLNIIHALSVIALSWTRLQKIWGYPGNIRREEGIHPGRGTVPLQCFMHTHSHTHLYHGQFISANSCAGMSLKGELKPENPDKWAVTVQTVYKHLCCMYFMLHPRISIWPVIHIYGIQHSLTLSAY